MITIPNKAITHGGRFHADDVFSTALLKTIHPDISVQRTFEIPDGFDGIVFDIGGGAFDHHQENSPVRENGIPYAAFGLLWRAFGEDLLRDMGCTAEQAAGESAHFDESFIQPLDEADNTGCKNQLAAAIGLFNPHWDSTKPSDDCFAEALHFAVLLLQKKFESIMSVQRAVRLVQTALGEAKEHIVVLPRFAPWKQVLVPSKAEFVVYPSQRGGYSAQVVPVDMDTNEAKCAFPVEWAGRSKEELQGLSGISTLTFCHKSGFLISADRLDDVIAACNSAREKRARRNKNV